LLHLLDANVLITANRLYYPLERVPEYWDWLLHYGQHGQLKLPVEMAEEIREGSDDLAAWLMIAVIWMCWFWTKMPMLP
jgi:hypothetical protein